MPLTPPPVPLTPPYVFDPTEYSSTMIVTALVSVEGTSQVAGTLMAFFGLHMRGLQTAPAVSTFGPYQGQSLFQIIIYGNTGEFTQQCSFRFHVGTRSATITELVPFASGTKGSVVAPLVLTGETSDWAAAPPAPPPVLFNHHDFERTMSLTVSLTRRWLPLPIPPFPLPSTNTTLPPLLSTPTPKPTPARARRC